MKRHLALSREASRTVLGAVLGSVLLLVAPGCDFSSPSKEGVGITNVTQAAPQLPEFDQTGQYTPYYATADLNRPRYFHVYALTQGGMAMVLGGSDERGYSGVDTVEMYDQSTFDKDSPLPESKAGLWIDTNFEGDPIAFQNGARMLFTVTPVAEGKFLIVGGSGDLLGGPIVEKVETFNPETRVFESLEEEMVQPRFRHHAVKLNDGSIVFIAGQIQTTVTVINEEIPEGYPGRQTQVTVFATFPESELYDPTDGKFRLLTLQNSDKPSKLNTPRGRAGYAITRIAGPDAVLQSADDILLIAGGFQALSAQFAPRNKQPGAVARIQADGMTSLEFYDPLTRIFTQVSNVQLTLPRINDPYVMNLGTYNDSTIDGVKGVSNVVLITNGNTDEGCPLTPLIAELFVANFTGFGPAQGLQFYDVQETQFYSHVEGTEYLNDVGDIVGRCATNPLPMPRLMASLTGGTNRQTWVISLGGVDIKPVPGGCLYTYGIASDTMRAGCAFDPYYSLLAVQLGISARDLVNTRSRSDPTGIVGTWLTIDGQIPTTTIDNFGTLQTNPPSRWAKAKAGRRIFYTNIPVAGADGLLFSSDDRVLLAGGGVEYVDSGGEPTAPSCEIFLPPGSSTNVPTP